MPNLQGIYNTHPNPKDRVKNAKESISVLDLNWVDEGRLNLYHNYVLTCKKSAGRVSFVINRAETEEDFYQPENPEQKITRIAYISYINGDMNSAIKYFKILTGIRKDYIPYLYLSLANEYLYNQTKEEKYLKHAQSMAQKALDLNPNNGYTKNSLKN